MVVFLRKTEFKALKKESTWLSETHSERHSTDHSPVWDTEPKVWEGGENIRETRSTTTFSHIPPTRLFWCKNSLDLRIYSFPRTTFLGSPQNKSLTASLDGSLFPNNIASQCQSHQELNVHLLFDPQIPVQDKIPFQSTCTCAGFLWVGWHFTVLIAQQVWPWMHHLPWWVLVPVNTVRQIEL